MWPNLCPGAEGARDYPLGVQRPFIPASIPLEAAKRPRGGQLTSDWHSWKLGEGSWVNTDGASYNLHLGFLCEDSMALIIKPGMDINTKKPKE